MATTGREMTFTWQQRHRPFNGLCVQPFKTQTRAPFCEELFPCADRPGTEVSMGGICIRPLVTTADCILAEVAQFYRITIDPWPEPEDMGIDDVTAASGYVQRAPGRDAPTGTTCEWHWIFRTNPDGFQQYLIDAAGTWETVVDTSRTPPYTLHIHDVAGVVVNRTPPNLFLEETLVEFPLAEFNALGTTTRTITRAGQEHTLTIQATPQVPF